MTPEERSRIEELIGLVEKEKDPVKYSALVTELKGLLDAKERRLKNGAPGKP